MAAADLEFHDINSEVKGSTCPGRLKLTDQNIVFKNSKTGKVDTLSITEIDIGSWLKLVGTYGLRLFLKNGTLYRFLGFKDAEKEKVSKYFRNSYKVDLVDKELCVKGWNWGTVKFLGSVLSFDVNNVTAFEIPLSNVSQCTTGKNEVTLEFHQNDDAPVSLMEMRYHIPSSELAGATDPVEAFHGQVMKQASVISVSGDAIAIFREIHILTPRGRYDIKIFPTFFQLHGKTFDYKVPMSTVIRLFILPHKDGRQHFLVISLDPPIKQGQTRYHYLVLLFNQDDNTSLELPFTEEELKTKYEGRISKELSGPTHEVLGKIMKVLVNRKITTPGTFKGHSGTSAVSCSFKAAAGYIYPLDRGFIYIHKPPIHIRFEEISSVNFARSGGSTRSFDFEVELKNGVVNTFSSIEKEEYGKLYDFIQAKKLRVKNRGKSNSNYTNEDFGDSDAEAAPDAYLARVKREGEQKYDDGDDDDDESTDEDFKPPKEEDESEVDDEYDSNVAETDSNSDSDAGGKKEKSKPKKEKSHKKSSKHESEKPKKKKRKEKDENRPKRPLTAYMIWFNETREQIKADNPGIGFTDLSRKGGDLWKKMTSKEKEVYDKKFNVLKEEYVKAMKEYEKSGKSESKSPAKKSQSSTSNTKQGSGSHYVSKEFIEDDSSSSDSDADKKKSKTESSKASSKKTESGANKKEKGSSSSESDSAKESEEDTKKKKKLSKTEPSKPIRKKPESSARGKEKEISVSESDSEKESEDDSKKKPEAKRKRADSSDDGGKKPSSKKSKDESSAASSDENDDSDDDKKKRKKEDSSSEEDKKKGAPKKRKDESSEEEDDSAESTPASDDDD